MLSLLTSRRKFLKLNLLALAALALPRLASAARENPIAVGRVTTAIIYVYQKPAFDSERIGKRTRDNLLNLLDEIQSAPGTCP